VEELKTDIPCEDLVNLDLELEEHLAEGDDRY